MVIARERATGLQRAGIALAVVEAAMFAVASAAHFGVVVRVGATTYGSGFFYPAAIVEAALALVLAFALVLPGGGAARAGRVLAAQILVVIGLFVGQIALMRAVSLATAGGELYVVIAFALALASIALVASPAIRGYSSSHRSGTT